MIRNLLLIWRQIDLDHNTDSSLKADLGYTFTTVIGRYLGNDAVLSVFYTSSKATSLTNATRSTSVNFPSAAALIKDRLPLSQLVMEAGVTLKKRGSEWVGCCPFHDEKTPSFSVNDQKGLYYCRGNCGAKGDVIHFFAQINGLEPGDAIVALSRRLGIALDERKHAPRAPISDGYRQRLLSFQSRFAEQAFFSLESLMADADHPVTHYCLQRGLSLEQIQAHRIGFLDPSLEFDRFLEALDDDIGDLRERQRMAQMCGLHYPGRSRSPFQGRLLFPIHDRQGHVCAFSGRVVPGVTDPESARQKYRNSPDTPIFDKSATLYGLTPNACAIQHSHIGQNWRRILSRSVCFLVEGYTDVIALQSAGFMAVAAMGTSITDYQIRYLMTRYNKLVVLTDGDNAGQKALKRTLLAAFPLLKEGQRLQGILLDRGDDPDSVVRRCQGHHQAIRETLRDCRTLNPEAVWFSDVIGDVSNPPTLGDQVRIEQALAQGSAPDDPAYRLALLRYLETRTGYCPGQAGQGRSFPMGLVNLVPDSSDLTRYWLVRFARRPAILGSLMRAYRRRWWYRDTLQGLLASNLELPATLRLLIVADATLSDALSNTLSDARPDRSEAEIPAWGTLLDELLARGFPSILAERWHRVAFSSDDPVLAAYRNESVAVDLWRAEWVEWLDALDQRLTSALRQALNDCGSRTERTL